MNVNYTDKTDQELEEEYQKLVEIVTKSTRDLRAIRRERLMRSLGCRINDTFFHEDSQYVIHDVDKYPIVRKITKSRKLAKGVLLCHSWNEWKQNKADSPFKRISRR